jgi:dTDP-4-dehydrorhamnose reductase
MPQKIILVTGANGQLGMEFRRLEARYKQYEFEFADHSQLPVEEMDMVNDYVDALQPFGCINCAAYTAVDKAESEKEKAMTVNGEAVGYLAAACARNHTLFIQVSTDYVFDGNSSVPYKETDNTNPVNHYGLTKLVGEQLALRNNPASIIIRTAWVYSEYGNNFVKTMMRLMHDREIVNVVNDQMGSPTYAADLAKAIMQLIISIDAPNKIPGDKTTQPAIFHYSNEGVISWYEFAEAIRKLTKSKCKVNPISTSQYPTPAKRPHFSLLDKSKIKTFLSLSIPGWRESLQKCIQRLQAEESL